MVDFTEAEKHERQVLTEVMKYLKPDSYTLSEIGSCEYWDFVLCYKDKSYIGDIKCMTKNSTVHDFILLEYNKVKNLVLSMYVEGVSKPPLYLCHYPDKVVRMLWLTPRLLNHYKPVWRHITGRKKLVYFIPLTEAKEKNYEVDNQ